MSGSRMHTDDDLLRALRRSADPGDRRLARALAPLRPETRPAAAASPALAAFLADGATDDAPAPVQLVELSPLPAAPAARARRHVGLRLALGAALAAATVGVAAAATGVLPVRDDTVVVVPGDHDPRAHDLPGDGNGGRDDRQPVSHPQVVPQSGSGEQTAGPQAGARRSGPTAPSGPAAAGTGVAHPRSGGSEGSGDVADSSDGGSGDTARDGGSGGGSDGDGATPVETGGDGGDAGATDPGFDGAGVTGGGDGGSGDGGGGTDGAGADSGVTGADAVATPTATPVDSSGD